MTASEQVPHHGRGWVVFHTRRHPEYRLIETVDGPMLPCPDCSSRGA